MAVSGCTSVLGIDGQYVEEDVHGSAGGGGGRSGGIGVDAAAASSGSGGDVQSGGAGGIAGQGAGGTASCGTNGQCQTGMKCCLTSMGNSTFCAVPEPAIGCSLTGCARCPDPPLNANPVCNGPNGDQCGFECVPNFVTSADGMQCDPVGTGGQGGQSGGTTGAGGKPAPACDPKACPSLGTPGTKCTIASPLGCCTRNDACGCTYAAQLYCY